MIRGVSSFGRALPWHGRGEEFEPPTLHHRKYLTFWLGIFYGWDMGRELVEFERSRRRGIIQSSLWIIRGDALREYFSRSEKYDASYTPPFLLKCAILAFFRARSINNRTSHEENTNLTHFN